MEVAFLQLATRPNLHKSDRYFLNEEVAHQLTGVGQLILNHSEGGASSQSQQSACSTRTVQWSP